VSPVAWEPARRGGSVFLMLFDPPGGDDGAPPYAGPAGRFVLRQSRRYPGLLPFFVGRYSGIAHGRVVKRSGSEAVVLTGTGLIQVKPSVATGAVEDLSTDGGQLSVTGWAVSAAGHQPADRLLAFSRGRLVATAEPTRPRPDVADSLGDQAQNGGSP